MKITNRLFDYSLKGPPLSKYQTMKIVLDVETTNLPPSRTRNQSPRNVCVNDYSNAFVIELGYLIIDDNHNVIKSVTNLLVHSPPQCISNTEFHGITDADVLEKGRSSLEVLNDLSEDLKTFNVDTMIAHNATFDMNFLVAESKRYGMKNLTEQLCGLYSFCTMRSQPGKFQKLNVLYKTITGFAPPVSHRALADCETCLVCYIHLVNKIDAPEHAC
jgi:DNA polymerase III epsilon subunit-like protein